MPVQAQQLIRRVRSWPRKVVITLMVVTGILLAGRMALPFVVQRLMWKSAGGNAGAKNQPDDQPVEAEKPAKP